MRVSAALFWRQFEGAAALPVILLPLAQITKAGKAEHVGIHDDYGRHLFQ